MSTIIELATSLDDGPKAAFPIEVRSTEPARFALGVRKSGSSVFSNLASAVAKHNQRNVVDLPGTLFELGYRTAQWVKNSELSELLWHGNVYVGFRDAPVGIFNDPVFRNGKKILVVRDPRDALVSEYFSNAYSHSLPQANAEGSIIEEQRETALASTIEDYVVSRALFLDRTVAGYNSLLGDKNLLVLRYEDVIFEKRRWIEQIADWFEMNVDSAFVEDTLGWADIRPEKENPKEFVRRVTPGDYKNKLSAECIKSVESSLTDVWKKLGYQFD